MPSDTRSVLVAVDPRGCAPLVAETAATLAHDLGVSAVLCTVVELPDGVAADTPITRGALAGSTAGEALDRDARNALTELAPLFTDRGVPLRLEVLHGDPAEAICARAEGMRLLVCGTHGRTGLGRLVFGSVAEQLVRHAPVPVTTVRTSSHDLHRSTAQRTVAALGDG